MMNKQLITAVAIGMIVIMVAFIFISAW